MNMNQEYEERLERHGIRPTSIRVMILRAMEVFDRAFDMNDLEKALDTVDKSSVFRTLSLFMEHHLIHGIDDGSGSVRYSLCDDGTICSLESQHIHFACTSCRKTFCIRDVRVPVTGLPAGFVLQDVNYVLKGLCPECAALSPEAENALETGVITHHV